MILVSCLKILVSSVMILLAWNATLVSICLEILVSSVLPVAWSAQKMGAKIVILDTFCKGSAVTFATS